MRMEGDQFYLRSPHEMYETFAGMEMRFLAANRSPTASTSSSNWGNGIFPAFALPPAKTSAEYLRELCEAGLRERYASDPRRWQNGDSTSGALSDEVRQRLERELDVINKLGFADYFLIVWDFRCAMPRSAAFPARPAVRALVPWFAMRCGSVTSARCSTICSFERFWTRVVAKRPDIDIDFCKDRRGEVIQYVKEKIRARRNVAQIGTVRQRSQRGPRFRDVGRTHRPPDLPCRSNRGDGA